MDFAKQYDCMYDCYWQDTGWTNSTFLENIRYYNSDEEVIRLIRKSRRPVEDLDAFIALNAQSVQKVQLCFRDLADRAAAVEQIKSDFPEIVATSSFRNNLELNWHTADKGRGLRILSEYLNVPDNDTIAFGDSSNDLTMLQAAGVGVAMGNAAEELKALCDAVTLSNEDDGVAVYLERYVL
jgi:Cof subfamily protein (haloacid dehalogenase superfamily)